MVRTMQAMTFKIDRTREGEFTILTLSGRIDSEHLGELTRILEIQGDHRNIIMNLQQIKLADRDAVRFLARCGADGIKLENCPAYIREWMEKEKI